MAFERFKQLPNMGPVSAVLAERLHEKGQIGNTQTILELSTFCGRDVSSGGNGAHNLRTAINYCLKVHGIYWKIQRGLGYLKCLDASERVEQSKANNLSIGKKARKTCYIMDSVNIGDLAEGQTEFHALYAQVKMLGAMSGRKVTKALEDHKITEPMTLPQLLDAFRKKGDT